MSSTLGTRWRFVCLLWKMPVRFLDSRLIRSFFFFCCRVVCFFYVLDVNPHQIDGSRMSSPLPAVSPAVRKLFGLTWSRLFIFCFSCWCLWHHIHKKHRQDQHQELSPPTPGSSRRIMVSRFTFKSLVHVKLIFGDGVR